MRAKPARVLAVGLIIMVTTWLGETLGPHHIEADVYRTLPMNMNAIVELLQGEQHPAGPRVVVINGQRMQTELSRVPLSPHEVLDVLEARSQPVMPAARTEAGNEIRQGRDIPQTLTAAMRRPFRLEGPGWGVYGKLASKTDVSDQRRGATSMDAFGGGILVLALETVRGQSSDVWTWHFSPAFNPLAMLGTRGEDAPGIDLPGISRYPGSRRVFSLVELSKAGETHVLAYEGDGNLTDHAHYYDNLLNQRGFRALRGRDSAIPEPVRVMREYSGNGQEVAVFITAGAEGPGRVLDVIQVRLPTKGD